MSDQPTNPAPPPEAPPVVQKPAKKQPKLEVTTKISKGYIDQLDDACTEMRSKYEDLQNAIDEYNDTMNLKWDELMEAVSAYNESVSETDQIRAAIYDEMQSYYDDKSEKWQEGDRGVAYSEWMEQWNEELSTVDDLDKPDELEIDIDNHADDTFGYTLPYELEG